MTPLRILFICPYIPSPVRVRPYNFIKYLAKKGHRVTLLALNPPGEDMGSLPLLQEWCEKLHIVLLPRWRTLWNALCVLPSRTPLQAAYSRSPEMSALINQVQHKSQYDVVHVEHLRGAELSQAVNGTPTVFDSVDSITLLFEHTAASGPTWRSRLLAKLDLARTRFYESQLLERYPRLLVTSPKDKAALVRLSTTSQPERIDVVPNGVDLDYFAPLDLPREPATLIFSGKMSYHANVAAALDLAQQVMPLIWQQLPAAKLVIAGKDPSPSLKALAEDSRVVVTGTVPDLRPYLAQATVAVSPMRYGVGIQNKILEAMAMGTPVITNAQVLSALQTKPGQDLVIANTPAETARTALDLIKDADLAQKVGQAGRCYVESYHDWQNSVARLEESYRTVMVSSPRYTAHS